METGENKRGKSFLGSFFFLFFCCFLFLLPCCYFSLLGLQFSWEFSRRNLVIESRMIVLFFLALFFFDFLNALLTNPDQVLSPSSPISYSSLSICRPLLRNHRLASLFFTSLSLSRISKFLYLSSVFLTSSCTSLRQSFALTLSIFRTLPLSFSSLLHILFSTV